MDESFREISLYFHIPFCRRKCDYCHFYVIPEHEDQKSLLLKGFQAELALYGPALKNKRIVSLYFGGGTPSLFGPEKIAKVLDTVAAYCPILPCAEITLEANPENIAQDLMQAYADAGINRVSIGIQTLDSGLLNILGRLHDPEIALQAILATYRAGLQNISIDLMYDLPKQTLEQWNATLATIQTLPLQHLSLYNLTIEPHTLFFKKQDALLPLLPDEEASLAMYLTAREKLEEMGLKQYEISAFARPGAESRHNAGYWMGRPFLGFGPSAFSYWQGKRFRNIAHLKRYCQLLEAGQFPIDFEEELDPEAHRRELLVIQLRMCQGVSLDAFTKKHGGIDAEAMDTLQRLIQEGFLMQRQERIFLTERGILFYDTVAADLI